jgi:hypothetical protein
VTDARRRFQAIARGLGEAGGRFAFAPVPPHPLGLFRIAVSVVALVQLRLLWPYLHQLYGNFGFVQWVILETSPETWLPSIGKICLILQPYGVSSAACVKGVFGVYALSLVGLALGWKTRLFAIVAWLSHALTINSGYLSLYGVDTMIHICLFYFVWMPVGAAFSIDNGLRRQPAASTVGAGIALRTLQFHLCIIYLNAGTAKMRGAQWWNGEAIWRAFMNPEFGVFDFSWLARVPAAAVLLGWSTLLIEVGYPFFIWPLRVRPWWVAATVGLHLGIAVTMGLWMFSVMMIVMTMSAFGLPMMIPSRNKAEPSRASRSALGWTSAIRSWIGATARRS